MGLFTSKWKNKNPEKRKQWIKDSDPSDSKHLKILADIAKNDQNDSVRDAAMRQIKYKNPKILADIALNDKNEEIRKQARQLFHTIECPKCGGLIIDKKSLFSDASGYGCINCNWRRRYCPNTDCKDGYLEYTGDLSQYPLFVNYTCIKCGYSGSGHAFHDKNAR